MSLVNWIFKRPKKTNINSKLELLGDLTDLAVKQRSIIVAMELDGLFYFCNKDDWTYRLFPERAREIEDLSNLDLAKPVGLHELKAIGDLIKFLQTSYDRIDFLDIGANIGAVTLPVARYLSAQNIQGKVHAFEPGIALELLQENVELNNLGSKVNISSLAVSSYNGKAVFRFELGNSEHNRLVGSKFEAEESFRTRTKIVSTMKLDSYEIPDNSGLIVKIDTEGNEPRVLAGMTETLQRNPVVIFEYAPVNLRKSCDPEELIARMSRDFHLFETKLGYTLRKPRLINESAKKFCGDVDARPERWTDVIAIPKALASEAQAFSIFS